MFNKNHFDYNEAEFGFKAKKENPL